MDDDVFMTLMKVFPRETFSSVVGAATRARVPPRVHQLAMRAFAAAYDVDLKEAEHPVEGYDTFSEFFCRKLKPGARPIVPGDKVLVSPVDGAVSQIGYVREGKCIQAKGIEYPVGRLLGDDASAHKFMGGAFATLYLSPRDYHRIHAPLGGRILGYSYIPGEFWPVNPRSVRNVEALFTVNERLITFMDTPAGFMAVVAVGATAVSRIRAAYDEKILTHNKEPAKVHRYESPIPVAKGDELGRFEMGSTVILLFETDRVRWDESFREDSKVRMGERLGDVK